MRSLIHTHIPFRLLVESSIPNPLIAECHSAIALLALAQRQPPALPGSVQNFSFKYRAKRESAALCNNALCVVVETGENHKKAGTFFGKEAVKIQDLELPEVADDVDMIQNLCSSICGTDVAVCAHDPNTGQKIDVGRNCDTKPSFAT